MPYTDRELADAIAADQFRLMYQPLVQASTLQPQGVEALVRWQHPERGFIGPNSFLPAMERANLMARLTDWTIEHAVHASLGWGRQGLTVPVSVNLSATLLQDQEIVSRVLSILRRHSFPSNMLTLEVTETALALAPAAAAVILDQLRAAGIHVSVDDFGTGYTSLAMLKEYTFDEIKIDRSFVAAMRHSPADAAIVRSIRELGHRLGLKVVAEGIEDPSTARLLTKVGCDILQGFHFARPMLTGDVVNYYRSKAHTADVPRQQGRRATESPAASGAVPAPLPADEDVRLSALLALQVLDTAPEQVLDDLVAVAAKICGTSTALLSLVDRDRQWFKARTGLAAEETSREVAFCAHAILQPDQVMEVADATKDPRFAANPLVTGDPNIRFYAGAPLVTDSGQPVGTLCVLDDVSRSLNESQRDILQKLSHIAVKYLQLSQSDALMHRVHDVTRTLSRMHAEQDVPAATSAVVTASREILQAEGAVLLLAEQPGSVVYRASGVAASQPQDAADLARLVIDSRQDSATATVVRSRKPLWIPNAATSDHLSPALVQQFRVNAALYVPLLADHSVVGVLALWWTKPQDTVTEQNLVAASILADEASSTLTRLQALAALRQEAETDPLTGLLNRRSFEIGVSQLPIDSGILMLDLDHFKHVNDAQGHQAGDQLLKSFSAHLKAAARTNDLVARWGGEEFVVALSASGYEGLQSFLLRLRLSWDGAETTFSSGYTTIDTGESAASALIRADKALYRSKIDGRNRDTGAQANPSRTRPTETSHQLHGNAPSV